MKNEIKCVLFDMDGVIMDDEYMMLQMSLKAAEIIGRDDVTADFITKSMGLNILDYRNRFLENLKDFPFDEYARVRDSLRPEYARLYPIVLKDGVIELLEYLKNNNIHRVICTSTPRDKALEKLDMTNVTDYFEAMVCGDDVVHSKPNPEIYLKGLDVFSMNKENTIIIEDSRNGLRSAINAEIDCVLIPDVAYLSDEDKASAYRVVKDLTKVIDIIEERR